MKHVSFFSEEDAARNGCVNVCIWVMIQADHIAPGDKVKEDRGEESEEGNHSTESSLHRETLDSKSCLKQDLGHDDDTGQTGAVREKLHP